MIELGIGLMELGIGLTINYVRRTVLAHVSGLVNDDIMAELIIKLIETKLNLLTQK